MYASIQYFLFVQGWYVVILYMRQHIHDIPGMHAAMILYCVRTCALQSKLCDYKSVYLHIFFVLGYLYVAFTKPIGYVSSIIGMYAV